MDPYRLQQFIRYISPYQEDQCGNNGRDGAYKTIHLRGFRSLNMWCSERRWPCAVWILETEGLLLLSLGEAKNPPWTVHWMSFFHCFGQRMPLRNQTTVYWPNRIFVLDVKLSSYNTDYKNRENRSTNRGRSCSWITKTEINQNSFVCICTLKFK